VSLSGLLAQSNNEMEMKAASNGNLEVMEVFYFGQFGKVFFPR